MPNSYKCKNGITVTKNPDKCGLIFTNSGSTIGRIYYTESDKDDVFITIICTFTTDLARAITQAAPNLFVHVH